MEFLAATKSGLFVMDATSLCQADDDVEDWTSGLTADGQQVKVVAKIPSSPNAFGHAWSLDGKLLGSVCDDGARVYEADRGYKELIELPKVAPDVGGRSGGVRNLQFSPKNNFLVTYEKWDPQYPNNVHVWDLRTANKGQKVYNCVLRGYTSGALPQVLLKWTVNESACVELVPGEGLHIRHPDLSKVAEDKSEARIVPEKLCTCFEVAQQEVDGSYNVACYVPEIPEGRVARISVYHLNDPTAKVTEVNLPAKVKDCKMLFNSEGTELLALASCDVDETGSSYFGTTYLYWISVKDPKKPKIVQVCGSKEGLVQDLCWCPTKNEFMVIYGMLPATVALHDGTTSKQLSVLGVVRRNTLKWCPFGRFVAVGGFGTLPGDLDFFDRTCEETVSSLRAALSVECNWAPDGRHFMVDTIAPRMNEGNQLTIYRYTGEKLFQIEYNLNKGKENHKDTAARHEDDGGGARTKTQAFLYSTSWRPGPGKFEDKPATPRGGGKRKKGLPEGEAASKGGTGQSRAYQAGGKEAGGGGGGSLIAAMMRGEVDAPAAGVRGKDEFGDWKVAEAKPLEEWELRKMDRDRKKEADRKEQEAADEEKAALKGVEAGIKDTKKKLKDLKKQLEELEALADKDWDELTEEDEAAMELESDIRAQIAELEKANK